MSRIDTTPQDNPASRTVDPRGSFSETTRAAPDTNCGHNNSVTQWPLNVGHPFFIPK